jgi:cytochrome c-type biogenesis protein CcmH
MRISFFPLLFIAVLFLIPGYAEAQGGGPTANEVNAIAKNLYCPVCENVPLDACPTLACQQWRQQIADKLTLGWNEDQIYDFFVEQYGDRVLATPPLRGLNWLIYLLPPLAISLAAFLLYRNMKQWRKPESSLGKTTTTKPLDYVQELEDELKARE